MNMFEENPKAEPVRRTKASGLNDTSINVGIRPRSPF